MSSELSRVAREITNCAELHNQNAFRSQKAPTNCSTKSWRQLNESPPDEGKEEGVRRVEKETEIIYT